MVTDRSKPSALEDLSDREHEVLGLVAAQGHSNTSVAEQLSLSDRTVEAQMRSVFTELGLHDDGSTHGRLLAVVSRSRRADRDGSALVACGEAAARDIWDPIDLDGICSTDVSRAGPRPEAPHGYEGTPSPGGLGRQPVRVLPV